MIPSFAFEGVVRLTRVGTGYLLFTLVIGFAALNTGNNSLYIGLSVMLGALLVSGMASKGGLQRIRLELVSSDEAWAARPVDAFLRVENGAKIWNVRDVIIVSELLDRPVHLPEMRRGTTTQIPVRFVFPRRGPVKLERVDLYTRYPFGLFLKKRRASLEGEVLVYPRLLQDARERLAAGSRVADVFPRRKFGSGTEIHGFRDYVRGDSLRHIHWKKSAAVGRWVMKQPEEESAPSVVVAIDPVLPAGESEERFEEMISEATTLLHDALEKGAEVALILPGDRIRGRGPRIRRSIFGALARIESETGGDLPLAPRGAILFSLRSEHALEIA